MDLRRFFNKAQGLHRLSDRVIEFSEIGRVPLIPRVLESHQIVHEHEIWVWPTDGNTPKSHSGNKIQQKLQLTGDAKVLLGQVELTSRGRNNGMAEWPNVRFNDCSGFEFGLRRGHPLYSEFKYFFGGDESHRAKYLELLADCRDREIRIVFPGLLQFVPSHHVNRGLDIGEVAKKTLIGRCNIYSDLPSADDLLAQLWELGY